MEGGGTELPRSAQIIHQLVFQRLNPSSSFVLGGKRYCACYGLSLRLHLVNHLPVFPSLAVVSLLWPRGLRYTSQWVLSGRYFTLWRWRRTSSNAFYPCLRIRVIPLHRFVCPCSRGCTGWQTLGRSRPGTTTRGRAFHFRSLAGVECSRMGSRSKPQTPTHTERSGSSV